MSEKSISELTSTLFVNNSVLPPFFIPFNSIPFAYFSYGNNKNNKNIENWKLKQNEKYFVPN